MGEAALKHIFHALPYLKKTGAEHIWFDYDKVADVLYVSFQKPQKATDTDIMDDGTLIHLNGKKVVGYTILNYSKIK